MDIKPGTKFKTVDDYIAVFPKQTKQLLRELRDTIKELAPKAEEVISYNMPAFKFHGLLIWYAGYKNHIGLYPKTNAIKVFEKELAGYKTSKGAIQFPIEKGIPIALVKKIVKFRIKENMELEKMKQMKKGA
mgnify:FL=1